MQLSATETRPPGDACVLMALHIACTAHAVQLTRMRAEFISRLNNCPTKATKRSFEVVSALQRPLMTFFEVGAARRPTINGTRRPSKRDLCGWRQIPATPAQWPGTRPEPAERAAAAGRAAVCRRGGLRAGRTLRLAALCPASCIGFRRSGGAGSGGAAAAAWPAVQCGRWWQAAALRAAGAAGAAVRGLARRLAARRR